MNIIAHTQNQYLNLNVKDNPQMQQQCEHMLQSFDKKFKATVVNTSGTNDAHHTLDT